MYLIDLFRSKVFTLGRLARLFMHTLRYGIQLSNVMHMIGDRKKIAASHRDKSISYHELFSQISSVSGFLHSKYQIKQGNRVLLIVDNSIPSVVLLFAFSALGCDIHLIGSIKDHDQFKRILSGSRFDFIFSAIEERHEYYTSEDINFITPLWHDASRHEAYRPFISRRTTISIFTSGTTGAARGMKRGNTLWQYLVAIADLVTTLRMQHYRSVILPVPIYHSYGLSALFLSLMLNKTIHLITRFDAGEVAKAIQTNNVEAAILIPQMLSRLLPYDFKSLACIVCCADVLPKHVLQSAQKKFGEIVFNLYGTSETGLATIATPQMLSEKPGTIGRSIARCSLKLIEEEGHQVLYVKSGFAIRDGYIRTGDVVTQDERGWYYLQGRTDHLLVINGTNVYPNELLEMAYRHEAIQHVEVGSVVNEQGFRKIKLVVQLKPSQFLNEQQFRDWWLQQYDTKFLPSVLEFRTNEFRPKLM